MKRAGSKRLLAEEDVEGGSCAHLESEVLAEHPGIESSGGLLP